MTTATDAARVADWLKTHNRIALITHLHPDGDALGASLALALALKAVGKTAFVCCQDPVPEFLAVLPAQELLFMPEAVPFEPEAVCCVDCASPSRFGRAAALIQPGRPLACVDHHETNSLDCDAALVDAKAAASGELVCALIDCLGVPLIGDMAVCLYVAISTDTGNFAFSCTTPACLRVMARCLELGLNIDDLNYELFRKRSMARTRLLGRALTGMQFLEGGRIALQCLRAEDFAACNAAMADTESIVNYGINTAGVDAAILAVEQGDSVKFSLRSRGKVNVAQLLLPLGGGGHDRAAGLTLTGMAFDNAVALVLSEAKKALA